MMRVFNEDGVTLQKYATQALAWSKHRETNFSDKMGLITHYLSSGKYDALHKVEEWQKSYLTSVASKRRLESLFKYICQYTVTTLASRDESSHEKAAATFEIFRIHILTNLTDDTSFIINVANTLAAENDQSLFMIFVGHLLYPIEGDIAHEMLEQVARAVRVVMTARWHLHPHPCHDKILTLLAAVKSNLEIPQTLTDPENQRKFDTTKAFIQSQLEGITASPATNPSGIYDSIKSWATRAADEDPGPVAMATPVGSGAGAGAGAGDPQPHVVLEDPTQTDHPKTSKPRTSSGASDDSTSVDGGSGSGSGSEGGDSPKGKGLLELAPHLQGDARPVAPSAPPAGDLTISTNATPPRPAPSAPPAPAPAPASSRGAGAGAGSGAGRTARLHQPRRPKQSTSPVVDRIVANNECGKMPSWETDPKDFFRWAMKVMRALFEHYNLGDPRNRIGKFNCDTVEHMLRMVAMFKGVPADTYNRLTVDSQESIYTGTATFKTSFAGKTNTFKQFKKPVYWKAPRPLTHLAVSIPNTDLRTSDILDNLKEFEALAGIHQATLKQELTKTAAAEAAF